MGPPFGRFVLLAIIASSSCRSAGVDLSTAAADRAVVVAVVDGDTVDLDIDGVTERVRLIGIDTPESVSTTTPDQCFGAEATTALQGLLPIDSAVSIQRDVEARDRYGRLLLYVHRSSDQLFVNEWMVANGFAAAMNYEPNSHLATTFAAAESLARSSGAGLWSSCDGPDQPLE